MRVWVSGLVAIGGGCFSDCDYFCNMVLASYDHHHSASTHELCTHRLIDVLLYHMVYVSMGK